RASRLLHRERDRAALAQGAIDDPSLVDIEIGIVDRPCREREILVTFSEARHATGSVGACADAIRREIARVRKAEPLIIQDAHADAALSTSDDGFHGALFDLD